MAYITNINYETGEVKKRVPEYTTMSRRPGIGADWLKKYMSDVYPLDAAFTRSKIKLRPPKYYDNLYDKTTGGLDKLKIKRKNNAAVRKEDNTAERLAVREFIQLQKSKLLIRSYENDK